MKKNHILLYLFHMLLATTLLLGVFTYPAYAQTSNLSLDRHSFYPGEEITVHFVASSQYPANAWVGIIPSQIPHGDEKVNDQHDISYQYLNKRSQGVLVFSAPSKVGGYDFRMHDTDNMGREICFVGFRVEVSNSTAKKTGSYVGTSSMTLAKSTFQPGEKIILTFQAPAGLVNNAWIGIIPSHISHGSEAENDKHDISYEYIKGRRSGTMTFTAPSTAGTYNFRMNDTDDNGTEIDAIKFEVVR